MYASYLKDLCVSTIPLLTYKMTNLKRNSLNSDGLVEHLKNQLILHGTSKYI